MKLYYIVNKDLNMSPAKVAVQIAHATTQFVVREFEEGTDEAIERFTNWFVNDQTKIILKGKQSLLEKLEKEDFITVRDLGKTEIEPNSLTCVCLGIGTKQEMIEKHKFFKRLRLL